MEKQERVHGRDRKLHSVIYLVYPGTITGDSPPWAHLRIMRRWINNFMAPDDEMEHRGLD
jgi:hypothetical protein